MFERCHATVLTVAFTIIDDQIDILCEKNMLVESSEKRKLFQAKDMLLKHEQVIRISRAYLASRILSDGSDDGVDSPAALNAGIYRSFPVLSPLSVYI
jgi:hypothetical protein